MPFLGPEGRKQLRQLGRVGTIGFEMALSVAVGVLGGRWLDGRFGTEPWLGYLGLFFGLAAAARSFYRVAQETRRTLSADSNAQAEEPDADPTHPLSRPSDSANASDPDRSSPPTDSRDSS